MVLKKESRNVLRKREKALSDKQKEEKAKGLKKYKKPPKIRVLDLEGLEKPDIEEVVETKYAEVS